MLKSTTLRFQDFITEDRGLLFTNSNQIAAVFGKQHYRVLRAIQDLNANLPADFNAANFGAVEYLDAKGERRLAYQISRDGFSLLAMGFTGKKALQFKLAYIEAFNAMDAYIKNQREGITYRCIAKELECKDSAQRGSFHGKGLNQRKQEKPVLEAELQALLNLAQPSLLN